MRLARLFRRQTECLAPPTASELLERVQEAAREVVEATAEAVDAAPRGHRGRTAVTVAAVTATALVATAAYVWWKRRDHVATIDAAPMAPVAPVTGAAAAAPVAAEPAPFAATVVEPTPVAETAPVEPAPEPVVVEVASLRLAGDCGEPRRGTPAPSVASTASVYSRPPAASGRFAMPGVRGVVLPGGGGSLP